jgi:hypothetical protein
MDPLSPTPPPDDPGNVPPHQTMQEAVPRPMEVSPIHVWAQGRCMAAFVVNVDSEDPLSAVFTVDAVIFQPPDKHKRDRFDTRAHARAGQQRWANNMQHASPLEKRDLTWHYPGRECLPEVVLRGEVHG